MQVASEMKPLGVRLPDDLRQSLKHQAVDNRRSLNCEILARLEDSIKRQDDVSHWAKKKGLGVRSARYSTTPCRRLVTFPRRLGCWATSLVRWVSPAATATRRSCQERSMSFAMKRKRSAK